MEPTWIFDSGGIDRGIKCGFEKCSCQKRMPILGDCTSKYYCPHQIVYQDSKEPLTYQQLQAALNETFNDHV